MAIRRYTGKMLREDVDKINGWCADDGIPVRLIVQGRNGYQAIDEYPVDESGLRIGTYVNRNVCCGSSRECGHAASQWYNEQHRKYGV